ncbi:MAG TPA: hypothetical protein VF469_39875 [Kofleriaceae bacterium]
MDLEPILRPRRKALVLAAESVVREARDKLPDKSQLNRLVSVCGEATCAEEIGNYLLYQASRQTRPWPRDFAELVIAKIGPPLADLSSDMHGNKDAERDRAKVAAWRLYAVFLTRAFTYARQQNKKGDEHDRARR